MFSNFRLVFSFILFDDLTELVSTCCLSERMSVLTIVSTIAKRIIDAKTITTLCFGFIIFYMVEGLIRLLCR